MSRTAFILGLLAAASAGANEAPEPVQFIDRSVITFPVAAADYTLAESHLDPENLAAGVTSKWVINGAPRDLRLTVFVYPIGLVEEQDAVAAQIQEVEDSMGAAVEQGYYRDLVVGAREPFVVVARAPSKPAKESGGTSDTGRSRRQRRSTSADDTNAPGKGTAEEPFDPMPRPEPVPTVADASDPLAATFAATLPSPNSHGIRQSFRFSQDDVPLRSLAYVFHRNLFGFKVRISAPADSMDDATFTALADTATRNLVPRIDVLNIGRCGVITLPAESEDSDPGAEHETARQLILGAARVRAANCAADEGRLPRKIARGTKRIEIVYPPGTWRMQD